MLKNMIQNELDYETKMFDRLRAGTDGMQDTVLTYSKSGFYYHLKGSKKRHYIGLNKRELLRVITAGKYISQKMSVLSGNIRVLKNILPTLSDYDDETIISLMPTAYVRALDVLRGENEDQGVIQSENPKHRDKLVIGVSNGLKVRSKGEMGIAEALLDYGLNIRYEKALKLTEKIPTTDGSVKTREVIVYPDFTIILPDGSEIYWEHSGMFDDPGERRTNFEKFGLYYDNGIYMPKNLIITMDSKDKPLDIQAIRRIIEGQILPLIK